MCSLAFQLIHSRDINILETGLWHCFSAFYYADETTRKAGTQPHKSWLVKGSWRVGNSFKDFGGRTVCVCLSGFFTNTSGIVWTRDIPEPGELWDKTEGKNKQLLTQMDLLQPKVQSTVPLYKPVTLGFGTTFQHSVETTARMCSPEMTPSSPMWTTTCSNVSLNKSGFCNQRCEIKR